jgi:hypothetical protein
MEKKENKKSGQQEKGGKKKQEIKQRKSGKKIGDKPERAEEEERFEGLEKTHQSNHQPLPGEGTEEAWGIDEKEGEDA